MKISLVDVSLVITVISVCIFILYLLIHILPKAEYKYILYRERIRNEEFISKGLPTRCLIDHPEGYKCKYSVDIPDPLPEYQY